MIAEDFYSTQSRLRQEQAELLSLLKDDSCAWPSHVEQGTGSGNHQKMKGKRPSRPPASSSGSPNTSTSEDDDDGWDGCQVLLTNLEDKFAIEK